MNAHLEGRVIFQEDFWRLQMLIFPEIHEVVLTFVMLSVLSPGIQPEFGNDPFHYKRSTRHVTFDKLLQMMRSTQRSSGLLLSKGIHGWFLPAAFHFPFNRHYNDDPQKMQFFVIKLFLQFRHRFKKNPKGQDGLNTQECFINHTSHRRVRNYCCAVLSVILVA